MRLHSRGPVPPRSSRLDVLCLGATFATLVCGVACGSSSHEAAAGGAAATGSSSASHATSSVAATSGSGSTSASSASSGAGGSGPADAGGGGAGSGGPALAVMPLMAGEIGSGISGPPCATSDVDTLMQWLDQHGSGYAAWDWDTWGGCLQLIDDYATGAPTSPWGTDYKNHLFMLTGK